MIQTQNYTAEDIEKFLEVNKQAQEEQVSESLRKLLSVKDKISIFKNIDSEDLKAIVHNVKFVKFKFKDYIVEQGDTKEEIFFIISGDCQVFCDGKKVGQLSPGVVFGETGAIFKTKRNASVVCSSKESVLLSFCIDEDNMEFCSIALANLYKNLASQINAKLEDLNKALTKK